MRRLRHVFTIAPLTPAVSAPNGGEHLGQTAPATSPGPSTTPSAWAPSRSTPGARPGAGSSSTPRPSPPSRAGLSYTIPWTVTEPQSGDYRLRVWYRDGERRLPSPTTTPTTSSRSPPLTPAVSAPNGGETSARHAPTTSPGPSTTPSDVGSFEVWAWSPSTAGSSSTPRPSPPSRADQLRLPLDRAQPHAGDYTMRVWYRDASGDGIAMDDSDAHFAIAALTPSRERRRTVGETVEQSALADVTWSLPQAVDVGSFDVYAWSPSTSWYHLNSAPIAAVAGRDRVRLALDRGPAPRQRLHDARLVPQRRRRLPRLRRLRPTSSRSARRCPLLPLSRLRTATRASVSARNGVSPGR